MTVGIRDLDFVNISRNQELHSQLFQEYQVTKYMPRLIQIGLLDLNGNINPSFYKEHKININTPLHFFAGFGSTELTLHYYELLLECFRDVEVHDLDTLLNKKQLKNGLIGKFCYYVGGVYGRMHKGEIDENTKPTLIHFRRKPFFIEWKVDPKYITSATAKGRISSRCKYLIYGKILDVYEIEKSGKEGILINIRPYAYGLPTVWKERKPFIHYVKKHEEFDKYFQEE